MYKKQKLQEIYGRLKTIADRQLTYDNDLHQCLQELETELYAESQNDTGDEGGNSPSEPPDLP